MAWPNAVNNTTKKSHKTARVGRRKPTCKTTCRPHSTIIQNCSDLPTQKHPPHPTKIHTRTNRKNELLGRFFKLKQHISLSMPKPEFKSDDNVREDILRYLYRAWENPRGMDSHRLKISQITSDLKKEGIEKKYVIRNLLYLIETGWAKEDVKEGQYFTGKMSVPTEKKTYFISQDGIDYFAGSSRFQKSNKFAGININ